MITDTQPERNRQADRDRVTDSMRKHSVIERHTDIETDIETDIVTDIETDIESSDRQT